MSTDAGRECIVNEVEREPPLLLELDFGRYSDAASTRQIARPTLRADRAACRCTLSPTRRRDARSPRPGNCRRGRACPSIDVRLRRRICPFLANPVSSTTSASTPGNSRSTFVASRASSSESDHDETQTACCKRWRIASISDASSTSRAAIGCTLFRSPSRSSPVMYEPHGSPTLRTPHAVHHRVDESAQLAVQTIDLSSIHNDGRSHYWITRKKVTTS